VKEIMLAFLRHLTPLRSLMPESMMKYGIAGLVIRLILAPITATTYDIYPGYLAIMSLLGGGTIYDERAFSYPPLFLVLLYPLMLALSLIIEPASFAQTPSDVSEFSIHYGTISPTITSPIFNLVYKSPMIIADMLIGLQLYHIVWETSQNESSARKAYMLWILNPLVIQVSAVHGSFDSICVFFAVLAVYRFKDARYFESGAYLAFGILTKIFPVFLIPVLLAALAGKSLADDSQFLRVRILSLFKGTIGMALGGLLVIMVFILPLMDFLGALNTRAAFTDISGFNLLFIQYWPSLGWSNGIPYDAAFIQNFLYATEYSLLGLLGVLVALFYWKHGSSDPEILFTSVALSSMVVVFTLANSYPQYFLWFIPFLALLSNKRGVSEAILLFSFAGLIWEYAIQGILAYLYPLAVFSNLLTTGLVNNDIMTYLGIPGILNTTLRYDMFLLSTSLAFFVFVIVMVQGVVQIAKRV
jgi:hypothetical protein